MIDVPETAETVLIWFILRMLLSAPPTNYDEEFVVVVIMQH